MYDGRSINTLQNVAIPLILKIGKIRNIRFVGNLILNIHRNFFDDDIIIVIIIEHSLSLCYFLYQFSIILTAINSTGMRKNELELWQLRLDAEPALATMRLHRAAKFRGPPNSGP